MFALIIKILALLLSLGIIVLIHELGHHLAAKSCGVRVQKLSMFLSPFFYIIVWRPGRYLRFFVNNKTHDKLVDEATYYDLEHFDDIKPRSWRDTEYTLGWVPIGGYCLFDTQFSRSDPDGGNVTHPYWDIRSKNAWKRLFITLSGVFANIILALCLFVIFFFTVNRRESSSPLIIYSSYAQSIGFQNDDEILLADTFHISNPIIDMNSILTASSVTALRKGDTVTIDIPPYFRDSIYNEADNTREYPFIYYDFCPIVKAINPQSVADSVGIKVGDKIVALDSTYIYSVNNFLYSIVNKVNQPISLIIFRNIENTDTLHFDFVLPQTYPIAGMEFAYSKYGIIDAMVASHNFSKSDSIYFSQGNSISKALSFTSNMASNLTSNYVEKPKEVVKESGGLISLLDIFPDDWNWLLLVYITSIFSIAMAIFNLIPFPGLDGGQAIFCVLEIVLRRKLNNKVLGWINSIGWIILILWIVYLNARDLFHLF